MALICLLEGGLLKRTNCIEYSTKWCAVASRTKQSVSHLALQNHTSAKKILPETAIESDLENLFSRPPVLQVNHQHTVSAMATLLEETYMTSSAYSRYDGQAKAVTPCQRPRSESEREAANRAHVVHSKCRQARPLQSPRAPMRYCIDCSHR